MIETMVGQNNNPGDKSAKQFTLTPETIQRYLKRRVEDLASCKKALSDSDRETLEVIGHRMRGSAESFGFPDLAALGTQLEHAAKDGTPESLAGLIRSLEDWVNRHPAG